ncbi:MAG: hypothetical protein HYX20_00525 [Candidatus Yanofskybacteria bacterium]|nr:hypothetical protein [Candidatus Yanofskybacteria bacterium]
MKKDFIQIIFLIVVIWMATLIPGRSFAYSTTGGNTPLPLPSIIDPVDILKNNLLKNAIPNVGNFSIGTTIPNLNLLNTKNLSSGDLASVLKAVAVLAINLFLIVIQTVAGILKALLPFLSG